MKGVTTGTDYKEKLSQTNYTITRKFDMNFSVNVIKRSNVEILIRDNY